MNQTTKNKHVLIAAARQSRVLIKNALSGNFLVTFADSMVEVMEKPYCHVDIIVCGLYFDESRMFDFLRYAKLDLEAQNIPFICVNVIKEALSPALRQSVDIACQTLGAVTFVDLCQWTEQYGADEAHRRFRQLIVQNLP